MARITKKKFKQAVKGSGGVQAVIAKAIGVTRQSLSTYLKKNPDLKGLLDEEGENIIDIAELNIQRKIVEEGNTDDSWKILLNSKRGKARGYGPRQEFDISDQRRIEILRSNDGINKVETEPETGTSTGNPE